MPNPPISISSLDFNDIKSSLVSYLKNQTLFNSYNFESSALSTLVNVLAYNTMLYGYYANMIANESFLSTAQMQENVISMLKPLGYVINGVNSSKITAQLTGETTITGYDTVYIAVNNFGVNYSFYPIKDYVLNSTETTEVELYNANSIVKDSDITSQINLTTQSYFLGGFDIDINTLKVSVTTGGETNIWERYDPYRPKQNTETNRIYFIERRDNGFYLLFARPTLEDIFGFFDGRSITSADTVKISYIMPVGAGSNDCILSSGTGTIVSSTQSIGGGTPDLDIIKSFAPKLFASSDRAVTKDDYYGVILNSNLVPSSITLPEQILVWGGEELTYPIPGRVFYSFADTGLTTTSVKSLTNMLKQKGMITIIPEYVPSKEILLNMNFRFNGIPAASTIKRELETYFNSTLYFNRTFTLNELLVELNKKYTGISLSLLSGAMETTADAFTNIINFSNPLRVPSSSTYGTTFYSGSFNYNDTAIASLRDTLISGTKGKIILYNNSTRTVINDNVGTIDYETGEIYINKEYIPEQPITVTAIPRDPQFLQTKYNNLFVLVANVTK